jgi:hypothetical protein
MTNILHFFPMFYRCIMDKVHLQSSSKIPPSKRAEEGEDLLTLLC